MGPKIRPAQAPPALALLLLCVALFFPQAATAQQTGGAQPGGKPSRVGKATKKGQAQKQKRERERKKRAREKREREAKEKEEKEDDSEVWDGLFPWADDGGFDDNWLTGLGLAALGILGALVTVFFFVGSFLPSMGGKAEYERLRLEIEELTRRRDQQLGSREEYVRDGASLSAEAREEATRLTENLNGIIEHKEEMARRRLGGMVALGFPVYVALGGAFAVLAASTAVQALLIGFGWTAVAERFGLKREEEKKKEVRDEESAKLAKEAKKSEQKAVELEVQLRDTLKTAATAVASSNVRIKELEGQRATRPAREDKDAQAQ